MPTNPLESMFRAYAAEHPSDAAKALETFSPAEAGALIPPLTSRLAGAVIPLMLRALGRDPAQSSSIFLTTVTDVVGFAAFLGFAASCLRWLT